MIAYAKTFSANPHTEFSHYGSNLSLTLRVFDLNDELFPKEFIELFQCKFGCVCSFTDREWLNGRNRKGHQDVEICWNAINETWHLSITLWASFEHPALDLVLWFSQSPCPWPPAGHFGYETDIGTTFELVKTIHHCDRFGCFERHFPGDRPQKPQSSHK